MKKEISVLMLLLFLSAACDKDDSDDDSDPDSFLRHDDAALINIPLEGSLQNPAFSPDGKAIVFTRFRNGYNEEPADLFIYNFENSELTTLVSDGSANVNLPGSSWNSSTGKIVFSSSRDPHDEIYQISFDGSNGDETRITTRSDYMAYEPTFSPDGEWVVFESHPLDVEDEGVIMKHRVDNTVAYQALTEASDDCRQPNWSPAGDNILYQKYEGGQWDIWIMKTDGSGKKKVTSGDGNKTDASFTSDGQYIIYSCDADVEFANIYEISINGGSADQITDYDGYDGAPSISPDGKKIVFESFGGDPDDSDGTKLYILNDE